MLDANENISIEFASKEHIEAYIYLLSKVPIEKRISFPDILRNLLPSEKNNIRRYYYDGENSLFAELAHSLVNTGEVTKAATRDLAIEIIRFLLCFPENCQVTEDASPFSLKNKSASFSVIQNTVKKIFITGAGPYGEAWKKANDKSFKIAGQIFQQMNIEELFQAVSQIEFTPNEIHAILQSSEELSKSTQAIYAKIRDAVMRGKPVLVYRDPENMRYHSGVKEYRFRAARGKLPNKGRVMIKEDVSESQVYWDIPIATPDHEYSDNSIQDRLRWIKDNYRKQ